LAHLLRSIGFDSIRQAKRHSEARAILESMKFDLILFDEDPSDTRPQKDSAQSIIDDLRRCGFLDMETIFAVTAPAATYSHVSEVVESGIDFYLLKPFPFRI